MQDGKGYTQALGGNTSVHRLGYLTWITTQLLGKQWHPIPVCRIMLILSKRYTLWNLLAGHLTLMGCTQTKKKAPGRIHGKKKSGLSSDSFLGFHYWPLLETQCWTKQSLSLLQSLSSAPEKCQPQLSMQIPATRKTYDHVFSSFDDWLHTYDPSHNDPQAPA